MLEELIAGNKKIILVIIAGLVAVVLLAIAIIGWYNYYKYIAQTDFQPTGAPSSAGVEANRGQWGNEVTG